MESADLTIGIGRRLSEDSWLAYNTLPFIFQYLEQQDIVRCSEVCNLWHKIANDPRLWRKVVVRDSKVHFGKMVDSFNERIVHLKLVDCKFMWNSCFAERMRMRALRTIEIHNCPVVLFNTLVEEHPHLEVVKARIMNGANEVKMDLGFLTSMPYLYELKLYCNREVTSMAKLFENLRELRNLCLLGVKNLSYLGILNYENFKHNFKLESLAFGEFELVSHNFVYILRTLKALKTLRLVHSSTWNSQLLRSISKMENLISLELLDISIDDHFIDYIRLCTNLKELTIVPKVHRFKMGRFNSKIMFGVPQLKSTLKKFSWGFSERYLKHIRDVKGEENCVPIVKDGNTDLRINPYPENVEEGLVEFDELERVLNNQMPHTEIIIVRVAYDTDSFI